MVGVGRHTRLRPVSPVCLRALLACSVSALFIASAQAADEPPLPRNNYGSMGLIDMPNARMAPDGELSAGAFFTQNIERYNLGFQALPWLELSFRYGGLSHFHPPYSVYFDRSFGLKARLWDETEVLPAVVLGVNDVVGTGVYGGEYIAASKQFGPFDATLGMGWGRLGSTGLLRNPLSLLSSSFDNRPSVFGATSAGATNFNSIFHGRDVGLFGGVAWATPIKGLAVVGEYSSDAYTEEVAGGAFRPRTQLNLGLSYQMADTITASVSWLYGRAVGGSLSFQMDPVHDPYPQRLGAPPPEPRVRTPEEQRAALDNLTRVRDTGLIIRAEQRTRGFLANNQLVDKLLQMPGLSDVSLRGHVIILSIARGDPDTTCRNAARFIGQYDTAITAISVSRGNASRQCPVMAGVPLVDRQPRGQEFQPLLLTNINDIAPPLLTIDATHVRSAASDAAAVAKIRADAKIQHVGIAAIKLTRTEASVYYANTFYFSEAEALRRLTKLLMQDAPDDIEKFRMISTMTGKAEREFDVLRAPAERTVTQAGDIDLASDMTMQPAPMENQILAAAARKGYPQFSWSIFPQFRQQLFDPDNPFGVQFLGGIDASLQLAPGLFVSAEAEASLWDNFNVNRLPFSDLPHVRTDFLKYFTEGKNGLGYLAAEYRFRMAPTVFASVRAGYLESMFAGAGGEMLWRPEGQRWALGVDAYEVQKRNFDRLFGLQGYRAFTGHISVYYASPWYNLNFAVRAGQYLAHDRGLSVEVTRRFETGVEIGAFFTKTNVSAQQFGEGSFDKGIILRIPLNWVAPINTQNEFDLDLRPVQRDGGQRLAGDARLYDQTVRTSYAEMWNAMNETP